MAQSNHARSYPLIRRIVEIEGLPSSDGVFVRSQTLSISWIAHRCRFAVVVRIVDVSRRAGFLARRLFMDLFCLIG